MADYTHGRFVWRDLLAKNLDVAKRFYGELLGGPPKNSQAPRRTLSFTRAKR